ncbi:MAG: hypothetical protein K1X64_06770 [Myxococcaceae bacterium]|nr:hypothetical protein [Myxococcaceae bacterium]
MEEQFEVLRPNANAVHDAQVGQLPDVDSPAEQLQTKRPFGRPGIARMKLIGSRTEQQLREELVRSNLALQDGSHGRLANALESVNVKVTGAYVLNWVPEQAEDIYTVLASADEVVIVEVPRGEGQVLSAREELAKYEGKCSKIQRIKVAVAKDLLTSRASNLSY